MRLETTLVNLLPPSLHLPLRYHYQKLRGRLEPEIHYLAQLGLRGHRAIDIGANQGIYSYFLAQRFEQVEAFEPQPWCTTAIAAYSQTKGNRIQIHHVGLSDRAGTLTLYIPSYTEAFATKVPGFGQVVTGLASFSPGAGKQLSLEVPVQRLDDYHFQDVGLIKIDVEGHERQVILGGQATLIRERPLILIEIEQRHLGTVPMSEIFTLLIDLGYQGSFLLGDRLQPLSQFHPEIHQKPYLQNIADLRYIHNFIFKPL